MIKLVFFFFMEKIENCINKNPKAYKKNPNILGETREKAKLGKQNSQTGGQQKKTDPKTQRNHKNHQGFCWENISF